MVPVMVLVQLQRTRRLTPMPHLPRTQLLRPLQASLASCLSLNYRLLLLLRQTLLLPLRQHRQPRKTTMHWYCCWSWMLAVALL